MGFFDRFKKKDEVDLNAQRIAFLREKGRITDGTITETEILESGETVAHYFYFVQGVEFESSEILSKNQLADGAKYAEGASVGVRYDPKNHGNSMLE